MLVEAFVSELGEACMQHLAPSPAIVPMTERYIRSFYQCLDTVARERMYLGRTSAPPFDEAERRLRAKIEDRIPFFLALVNEEVIGWCDITPSPLEGFTHCGTLGMGILAPYRGQGLGRQLLQAALTAARHQQLERIELEVYRSNIAGIRLYTSVGFVHEGIKTAARKLDGQYEDIVCMALFLETVT